MSTETADLHSTPTIDTALENQGVSNQPVSTSPPLQRQPISTLSDNINTTPPTSETRIKNDIDNTIPTDQQTPKLEKEEVPDLPGENASTTAGDEEQAAKQASQSIETNEDYQAVLKVLNVLKHQLNRANKDVETLTRMKREALEDPFGFVLELKSKKKLKKAPPPLQRILSVPELDWTKYRFMPESRFARQTASLAALTHQYTNAYKKPGMYKTIMDTPSPLERSTIRPPKYVSKDVKMLQRELSKGLESVGQIPSRAGSAAVSDASDSEDERSSSGVMNGKGKRRVSSQTGLAEKSSPATATSLPSQPPMILERPSSSSSIGGRKSDHPSNEVPTHNQPWTDEEQQRLEQLLEIYPDEPVQAQRFNKIAQALGSRNARQVSSRIQKYFIKLAKMGLPVPGRVNIPPSHSTSKSGRGGSSGRGRGRGGRGRMKNSNKARTSGIGYNAMISGGITNTKVSGGYYSSSTVPTVYMDDDENMDDNVKATMLRVANPAKDDGDHATAGTDSVIHEGFACDSCGVEPIVGVLYKCTVCDEAEEVDLCSKCMAVGTFTNDQHSADHPFEAVRTAAAPYYADNDYASPEHLGEYSYLGF